MVIVVGLHVHYEKVCQVNTKEFSCCRCFLEYCRGFLVHVKEDDAESQSVCCSYTCELFGYLLATDMTLQGDHETHNIFKDVIA